MANKKQVNSVSDENRMFIEAAMKQGEERKKQIEKQIAFTAEQQKKYGVGKKK